MKPQNAKRERETILGHYGQIITTRRTIKRFIWDNAYPVTYNTVFLISEGLKGIEDHLRLYSVCARLYYLSKLVFKGKDGIRKYGDAERYRTGIFEGYAETREEVKDILKQMYEEHQGSVNIAEILNEEHINPVIRCLELIGKLWCRGIACISEQIFIPELAYAFDYVIKHRGELPEPEYEGTYSFFPHNYKNYDYCEGIAKEFEDAMRGVF